MDETVFSKEACDLLCVASLRPRGRRACLKLSAIVTALDFRVMKGGMGGSTEPLVSNSQHLSSTVASRGPRRSAYKYQVKTRHTPSDAREAPGQSVRLAPRPANRYADRQRRITACSLPARHTFLSSTYRIPDKSRAKSMTRVRRR